MTKIMGYKGHLFVGTKGSTAQTRVTKRVDANYEVGVETGSTTSAGDGDEVPIETGEATSLSAKVTFNMIVDDTDPTLPTIVAAARTGEALAIRFESFTGLGGLDADCIISVKEGAPLKGEATMDITVEALSSSDREPELNS